MAVQERKTKIVLDADVIIHFAKGGRLDLLRSAGEMKEYARLISRDGLALGRGESACMVYCLYHHDVVGSSNTKDVTAYCEEKGITYLTTSDFLYYAIQRGLMTKAEADAFIAEVRRMSSFPPVVDFDTYVCTKIV